jgi:replication-associated recombination protein RarA
MSQPSFDFPQSLTEKYRPRQIADFVGIPKAKKLCANLASNPREISLIFSGPSGTGKTTLALALAESMPAELYHVPSQNCTLAEVQKIRQMCQYYPMSGFPMRLVLIDEADQMSPAAQIAFLSLLDATGKLPKTVTIFTCNSLDGLEPRFLSRCMPVEFSSYGISAETIALLERIWGIEAPKDAKKPDFARICKNACNNIRASLMMLDSELLTV